MTSCIKKRTTSVGVLLCILFWVSASFATDFAPPVAMALTATLTENTSQQVTFSARDIHLVGTFTYAVKSMPSHGQVTAFDVDHVTYTPARGYVGSDSFTYSATDNDGESDPVTVMITVIAAPAAPVVSLPAFSTWAVIVLIALLSTAAVRFRRKEI